MSATNLTKNLKLPQFVASDKPSWLGDVNGAMKNIDDGIGVIKGDITKASDTASSAKSQSDANTVTLGNVNTELTSIGNRVTALESGGGTEQLEQRLQTVESDVEALQTRADTFEEEIAENGKKITKNTSNIAALTPRVKNCEDNITSLQTTTDGLSLSTQAIGETANNALTTANKANGTANSATTLASNAYNQSQQNKNAISDINNKLNKKSSVNFGVNSYDYSTSSSNLHGSPLLIISDRDTNTIAFVLTIYSAQAITTTSSFLGRYDVSNFIDGANTMNLLSNPVTIEVNSNKLEISATKETNSNLVEFYIKSVSNIVSSSFNATVSLYGSFA